MLARPQLWPVLAYRPANENNLASGEVARGNGADEWHVVGPVLHLLAIRRVHRGPPNRDGRVSGSTEGMARI